MAERELVYTLKLDHRQFDRSELAGAVERLARRYARADRIADWRACVDEARDDLREAAGQWWLEWETTGE